MRISSILLLIFLIFIGCSSNKSNPVIPIEKDNSLDSPFVEPDKTPTDHQLLGTFTATFNIDSPGSAVVSTACAADFQSASSAVVPTAIIQPNRHPTAHHNITGLIPHPSNHNQ